MNEPLTAELTPITDRERRLMDVIERQNAQMQELSAKLHDAEVYTEAVALDFLAKEVEHGDR